MPQPPEIDVTTAAFRQWIFAHRKTDHLPVPTQELSPSCDAKIFSQFLKDLVRAPKCKGFRIYFACYPPKGASYPGPNGKEKFLTMIFVRTVDNGTDEGADDMKYAYAIINGAIEHLIEPIPSTPLTTKGGTWINEFRKWVGYLDQKGQDFFNGQPFKETRSLFYPLATVDNPAGPDGMIQIIDKLIADKLNPADTVFFQFACFTPLDKIETFTPHFQLTINFYIHQPNDHVAGKRVEPVILGSNASERKRGVDTDTGIPCPPDPRCPGDGGGFPNP